MEESLQNALSENDTLKQEIRKIENEFRKVLKNDTIFIM